MSQERPEIDGNRRATGRRRAWQALAAEAGEVASAVLPARRPGAGRTARAANGGGSGCGCDRCAPPAPRPGAFAIEWFTRRWVNRTGSRSQTFTNYIRRGTGDRYPRSALAAVAQPWELEIADALEERFADIRRTARSVSRLRTAFRQHAKLERTLAERARAESP